MATLLGPVNYYSLAIQLFHNMKVGSVGIFVQLENKLKVIADNEVNFNENFHLS